MILIALLLLLAVDADVDDGETRSCEDEDEDGSYNPDTLVRQTREQRLKAVTVIVLAPGYADYAG